MHIKQSTCGHVAALYFIIVENYFVLFQSIDLIITGVDLICGPMDQMDQINLCVVTWNVSYCYVCVHMYVLILHINIQM